MLGAIFLLNFVVSSQAIEIQSQKMYIIFHTQSPFFRMAENKIAKNNMNHFLETKHKYLHWQYPVIWCNVFITYINYS